MFRTFSTFFLALIAVLGLFADTAAAGLLPAESMMESGSGGMGSSSSSKKSSFLENLSASPVRLQQMGADDGSGTGMQTTQSQSPSSVAPCTLSECVELRLLSLTTYQICETRAILVVPFLDGIFRPPKTAYCDCA